MADVNRMTVDRGVLHHAVTPEWRNKSKAELAQWFSDNGFARAYGSNPANWSGLINPFTGGRSYSQTHAVGQMVDGSTPDATAAERAKGYRVFYIVADPIGQITWHAGDWTMNRRSMAIENLGDYRNYALTQGAKEAIADFFRPLDKAVGGMMWILLHNEVFATACPARIAEGRDDIINLINNAPAPAPVPPPAPPVKEKSRVVYSPMKKFRFNKDSKLYDLLVYKVNASSRTYAKGEEIEIRQMLTLTNGNQWYRTDYSSKNELATGFRAEDLTEIVPPKPVVTTKDETKTEAVPFTSKTTEDATLAKGTRVISVAGKNGVRTIVTTVTYTDGKETARKVKSDSITTAPVTEEVVVGTRVDTPKDDEQDARLTALEKFVEQVEALFAKIADAFTNWRKK